jgi:hypothetical protein
MSRSFLRTLALVIPATAAVLLPLAADANVRHTVGGAACQLGSAGNTPGQPYWAYPNLTGGVMYVDQTNTYPFGSTISCPVERNLPLSTDGLSDFEIRFIARNFYTGTRPVGCELYSLRPDGTIVDSTSKQMGVPGMHSTSNGDVAETVTMDFADAVSASASKGTYHLDCFMWPNIELRSIYVSEVDGISGN